MKQIALITALLLLTLAACVTKTRTVYNTLFSVESATTTAVDGYYSYVAKQYTGGNYAATNDVPRVNQAYNQFQSGLLVALKNVNWQSNTVAPFDVIAASLGVQNLIKQLTGGAR